MVTVVIIINIIVYININFINTIINVTAMLTWQNWRALSLVFQQANNNLLPFRVREPWTDLLRNEPEHDKTTKMTCAPTLIRVVTVRMKTDWANALADLSLCWPHGSFFFGFVPLWRKCIRKCVWEIAAYDILCWFFTPKFL